MRPPRRFAAPASLLALLGACQANPPPTEQKAATPAALETPPIATPPAKSPDTPTKHPTKHLPGKQPPIDASPTTAPTTSYTPGPLTAAAIDRGALLVWSRHDAGTNKTEILAQQLDDRGAPRGEPKLVRRTSGQILDLAVDRRDGAAWIAWTALLSTAPDLPRALVAAMQVEPDLSAARPPVTLGQFVAEDIDAFPERNLVDVLDLADGGAAVAAASSPTECTDIVTDRPTRCRGFELHWLRADGTHTVAGKIGADGGDPGMVDLVDVGTGVLFDAWAWHGGATFASLYAPYQQPAATAPFPVHPCRPVYTRAWTGGELVTICPDDYAANNERCTLNDVAAEEGSCTHVHTAVKGNKAAPLLARTRRCADGHPVEDLRWKGGKIRLDPAAPGASIDLELGVWTGTHAVKITGDGARELWTCNKSGEFTAAEAPGDTLALDPDPATLKSVPTHAL